jgi:hypothetical protein
LHQRALGESEGGWSVNAGAWLGLLLVVTFLVLPPGGEVPPVPKPGPTSPAEGLRRPGGGLGFVVDNDSSAFRILRGQWVPSARNEGYIRLRVDEKVCLEWLDEGEVLGPVLGGGKFGFREVYDTAGYYDNVRCYRLK